MIALSPSQVQLCADDHGLHLYLPPSGFSWQQLREDIRQHLHQLRPFWPSGCGVTLWGGDWAFDQEQLHSLALLLLEHRLTLCQLQTQRRGTAVAAASLGYSVDQSSPVLPAPTPASLPSLYLKTTIRSGMRIRHPGSVILLGDINPGGEVVADGDILVWGRLRGIAHAGYTGDSQALIMALQLQPTQLRLAEQVARVPESPPSQPIPEVAYLKEGIICIAAAQDFWTAYRGLRERL